MGGCRRQVGCNEGLWRCNQHYRKGGHLGLHILGVRREAGARVEEEYSEGWHLKWVWTKWSWGREGRETMSPGTEMVNHAWGVASPSSPGRGYQHLLHENLSEWLCSCLAPTSNPQKKKKTGFPRWHSGKESACQYRRHGFNLWVKKIPWRRKWQPLQYSCLENPMDGGAWEATVHGLAKSQT